MVLEIWNSLRRMPVWVQIWMVGILVPVNMLPLAFWAAPYGLLVAAFSVGGMLPNLYFLIAERGFSKRMALSHLLLWPPLVVLTVWLLSSDLTFGVGYWWVLIAVLLVDLISLTFDVGDGWKWVRGDRAIA